MAEQATIDELGKLLATPRMVRGVAVNEFRWCDLYDVSVLALSMATDMISPTLDLLALIQKHKATVDALLAISTRQPLDQIAALPISAGFDLAEAMFAVNQDFFFRRVPQLVRESISLLQQHRTAAPQQDGSAPSSSPAPAATPSAPTSSDSAPGPDAQQS